jgi:hypothetical protein
MGNAMYNRAPGFNVPDGEIAYLGSYFNPLKVFANGSNTKYLIPRDKYGSTFFVAKKSQAVSETDQAVFEKAANLKIPLERVETTVADRFALLKHLFRPEKNPYPPQMAGICGNRPYVLICIIDFYAEFSSSINIRENENGKKIDYFRKRSIIEKDLGLLRRTGKQNAVALEFFLVSTKDGELLWQGNGATTGSSFFDSYVGNARVLAEGALKNLFKK